MLKPKLAKLPILFFLALLLTFGALANAQDAPAAAPTAAAAAEDAAPATTAPVAEPVAVPVAAATAPAPPVAAEGERAPGEAIRDILLPMWQRVAAALPSLLKAIGLLLVFWAAGALAGFLVKRLLGTTGLDNRIAGWLGIEIADDDSDKVDSIAGAIVKWVILLFGFVAFFEALDLSMVAGPLQGILVQVKDWLLKLLLAGVVLALYWAAAVVLRLAVSKGLGAIGFDSKASRFIPEREIKGEKVGPSAMVGRLVFYVVLLLGIPNFLEVLEQKALVVPLRDMLSEVLQFIPNIVACLILFFVGKLIATIVREVVTNFLAATGADNAAGKLGVGDAMGSKKLSEVIGAISYFFIFIPILVAAVDSLGIKAISDPVKNTLERLLAAIPLIFVALVVILVGYTIAKFVRGLVESFLGSVGFDTLPDRLGLEFLQPGEGKRTLSHVAGTAVMIVILLLTVEQALATLELAELSAMIGTLIAFLPRLVVGLAVMAAALSLGGYVGGLARSAMGDSGQAQLVAAIARYSIVFLGFSMGLNQLGVAEQIITVAVSAVLGAAALALGLAFGLGGRERAKELLDRQGGGKKG